LALELPLLANENTKLVKKQMDRLLFVIIGEAAGTGSDSSLRALHEVNGLLGLHFCCGQENRRGLFVRDDKEDGVEEERKGFAVERNVVAIFLDLFFFCFVSCIFWWEKLEVLIVWKFLFLMIRFAGFRNLTQSFFKCLREFLSGNYLFIYLFIFASKLST
jgi:hypothetical protein